MEIYFLNLETMKRKVIIILGLIVFFGYFFASCTDCMECRQVRKSKGVFMEEISPYSEYCGESLEEIQSQTPVQTGTETTEWECR